MCQSPCQCTGYSALPTRLRTVPSQNAILPKGSESPARPSKTRNRYSSSKPGHLITLHISLQQATSFLDCWHDNLQAERLGSPSGVHSTCPAVAADPDRAVERRNLDCTGQVAHTVAECRAVGFLGSSSRATGSGPMTGADGKGQHRHVRAEDNSGHSWVAGRNPTAY